MWRKLFTCVVWLVLMFALAFATVPLRRLVEHKITYVPRPYCIDPFASEDLGQTVYTHCSLVPMWSIKV
jgi:hypothetical protein